MRAPGRVNLIGEHTDYTDGYVLPITLDCAVWLALSPRTDRHVTIYSLDFVETGSLELGDFQLKHTGWLEYLKGVAWSLHAAGMKLGSWQGVLAGYVLIGAGLSSSAAMELAAMRAFAVVSGLTWDGPMMARLTQNAEDEWVGVQCGIMDQMISACRMAGHALLNDSRSLDTQNVPLPSQTAVVIMDTTTRRGLRESAYDIRRARSQTHGKIRQFISNYKWLVAF